MHTTQERPASGRDGRGRAVSELDVALLEAAERELDTLADALHDGPVQSLVVARYAADAAVRGGDPAAVRDAVQSALVELRHTLWRLRPRGSAGLSEALQQLAAHQCSPVVLFGDADGLTGACATLAYRVVQAVAAPDAPPVAVAVRRGAGLLELTVTGGSPPGDLTGWAVRATALSGDLRRVGDALVLTLPLATLPEPRAPHALPTTSTPERKAVL